MSLRDRLRRRTIPRAIVALSTIDAPRRWAARLRRSLGGRAKVTLFFAFDDPYSAIAVLGLARVLEGRRVRLHLEPVVERGIPDDPARQAKREYAIVDSRRLARRLGEELARSEPLDPQETAFLARWTTTVPADRRAEFSSAAMRMLWLESNGPVDTGRLDRLWREHLGSPPPAAGETLRAERRMRRRRIYDTPGAVVHGRWFFAHERLVQIGRRLDELGWRSR